MFNRSPMKLGYVYNRCIKLQKTKMPYYSELYLYIRLVYVCVYIYAENAFASREIV